VKTLASQKRRALLRARKLLQEKAIAIENDIRGLLRNFGLKVGIVGAAKFEARIKELTEDIFQEAFIKAISTIQQGRYVESGRFLGWINRIAHNLIIDHFRREKNENTFSTDGLEYDFVNNSKYSEKSFEDVINNEQVLQDIVHLVNYLPSSQQEVVRMRFFEDLSFREIAERTDVSINTALGRMRYALMNMRKIASENNVQLEMK
jgi:RNA polymerase sigma-70 factor (ECF subfamily)